MERIDVVNGTAPIALTIDIPQRYAFLKPKLNASRRPRDLSCDERFTSPRRFVIKANCIASEQTKTIAIDANHIRRKRLGYAVGRNGIERRVLILWLLIGMTKHFTTASMQELRQRVEVPNDLKQSQRSHRSKFAGRFWDLKTSPHVTLASQMVDLSGCNFTSNRRIVVMSSKSA